VLGPITGPSTLLFAPARCWSRGQRQPEVSWKAVGWCRTWARLSGSSWTPTPPS